MTRTPTETMLLEALEPLWEFLGDAPTLDYGEDRVLSWISVMSERARRAIATAKGEDRT